VPPFFNFSGDVHSMKKGNFVTAPLIKSLCKFIFSTLTYAYLAPLSSFAQMNPADEETAFYRGNHYIPIKGEQDSDYPKGVYLVTDDVVIKKGKTMTFMPGTMVLLKKDTRITVEGRLICQGNPMGTIMFGRLANEKYFMPLDAGVDARWDGIFVAESGSVEISFSSITGSKYGLENNQASGAIILDTVVFKDNKFQNLKVAGNLICVPEDKSIFYSSITSAPRSGMKNTVGPIPSEDKKQANWKIPLRIGCGALALAGSALFVTELVVSGNFQKKSDAARDSADATGYYNKASDASKVGNLGAILGLLGVIGFTVTFFF
jgi:hypothetical protein